MDLKELMIEALEANRDNHVRMLQAFVRAPSPNPPGDTVTAAAILTDYLTSKRIDYELITPRPGQPNIVSEFSGGKPGPRVVLNGHIDVFALGPDTTGWDRDPWSGDVVDGRVHGRGVVDMKSGTASLVIAYAYLFERREHLKGSVALCAVSDEETGGKWGTKFLIQQDRVRWGGDVMLSAEPSGRTIRFAEKGTLRLIGKVKTRGAHGAYINLDKGAIRIAGSFLGKVVEAVESMEVIPPADIASHLTDPKVLAVVDQVMGPGTSTIIARPTVNIGIISGGTVVNVIPNTCTFELDIRLPIGLTAEQVLDVVRCIILQYQDAMINIDKREAASNPSSFSPIDHPMIKRLANNAEVFAPDCRPALIPSMGATDCKHYRYANIPAYVYGCSPYGMATVNESASIDEFVQVTKVIAAATWDFLQ
ncbi:putative acetylornithine deacetylase [Truncatella angustata]|uniref:Acetylornithine deacetylase n=1 Tax=Truncatella angustata TaxID=152316 RepID=A0A9P9A3S5_9PEZI|nr:putative acetylornithine deacetylase [Truncatella angustata]KAH6659209.1 putative acetylornithine deacetylase [Truncatella angustata]